MMTPCSFPANRSHSCSPDSLSPPRSPFSTLPTIGHAEQSTTKATENTENNNKAASKPEAEARAKTQNNLKNIAIALLNYNEAKKSLPPHAVYDGDRPLLSWRVLILPYLGEAELYREFHLGEPWDSDHNRKLIARMPEVFKNPKTNDLGMTNYLAVVGKECVFNGTANGLRVAQIADGTSHTIAVVESDRSVEWTKPDDWNFDRQHPTSGLGSLWKDHWYAAMVDGSIRNFRTSETAEAVGIHFTRAGGEFRSLQESANRNASDGVVGSVPAEPVPGGPSATPDGGKRAKFPSLEDQKLADLVWKRLQIELEPIGTDDLKRVNALGYDGGLRIVEFKAQVIAPWFKGNLPMTTFSSAWVSGPREA